MGGSTSTTSLDDAVRKELYRLAYSPNWGNLYGHYNGFGNTYNKTPGYRETLIYAPSNMNVQYTFAYIGNDYPNDPKGTNGHPGGSFMFVGPLSGGGTTAVTSDIQATRVHMYNGTSTNNNAAYVISTSGGGDRTLKISNGSYI